jgi:hypothetical protein
MKTKDKERMEAVERLREWLKPGDTVYTIMRHVSRSGMQREISLRYFGDRSEPYDLDYNAALAMSDRIGKHDGIIVGGCGMDMGFHLVYNLGRTPYTANPNRTGTLMAVTLSIRGGCEHATRRAHRL